MVGTFVFRVLDVNGINFSTWKLIGKCTREQNFRHSCLHYICRCTFAGIKQSTKYVQKCMHEGLCFVHFKQVGMHLKNEQIRLSYLGTVYPMKVFLYCLYCSNGSGI